MSEVIQRIVAFKSQECREIYHQVKEQLTQEWKNHYLNQVYKLARKQINSVLYDKEIQKSTQSEILASFEYETFRTMQTEWLKHGHMLWYCYGNLTPAASI